ncbi:bifunctional enoyl-CoA hydratase/phosphate acetyltransferase [Parvularcula oceani]|uniref:bifunctional enoyl-CoA hydratase/phosphate acetyltransferase n=1 Tax=Parvularcula oceani TaxID=1247963 RepID=UPI0004E157E6|nr:bifunctional enoyl-CoA hydratase/phosphate acetyltransferase [Parvularcula oceani]
MRQATGRRWQDLAIGEEASLTRRLTMHDIAAFAGISGDVNPAHMDEAWARSGPFHGIVAHGAWTASLISTLLGTELPGPGTIYLRQDFRFTAPVRVGDEVRATVQVAGKPEDGRVLLACRVSGGEGDVLVGEAEVLAPREARAVDLPDLPALLLPERGERLHALMAAPGGGAIPKIALIHPVSPRTLGPVLDRAEEGRAELVLVGPRHRIEAAAADLGRPLGGARIEDVPHSHAAGARAAEMAGRGEADILMKGDLHTSEVLAPVLDRANRLRTERRVSHAYVMDAPAYHKLLIVTDAAVNVAPSLSQKADILANAGALSRALGTPLPKAAILSAVETVEETLPTTVEAAALKVMADRGQLGVLLADGPLAFDLAVSPEAVAAKRLRSAVAGDADILLAPDLEAGNILAKQLDHLGGAVAAGVVLGARVPIALTSRSEGALPRKASLAVAERLWRAAASATEEADADAPG